MFLFGKLIKHETIDSILVKIDKRNTTNGKNQRKERTIYHWNFDQLS